MIVRACMIKNRLGLHARAASQLVEIAQEHGARVTLKAGDRSANAKSIMSVLILAATQGTEIELQAEGEDELEAIDAIETLINNLFGEGE